MNDITKNDLDKILSALNDAEAVYNYLEKIEPYEEHEMPLNTPNPDCYWGSLNIAKRVIQDLTN